VGLCQYGMARPQVLDRGPAVIWRVFGNILNKQSQAADKMGSSILGVEEGANNSSA